MPSDPEAKIGCLISEQAAINVEKQVNDTVAAGAKLVFGGRRKGAFYEPTILDGVTKDMDVAKDMEIFGPVVPIIEFEDLDEAIEIYHNAHLPHQSPPIALHPRRADRFRGTALCVLRLVRECPMSGLARTEGRAAQAEVVPDHARES